MWLDVESIRSFPMVNAAVLLDTIPSMVFADSVPGIRSMIRVWVSAESPVMPNASMISLLKPVSVYLNITKWPMEPVEPAPYTPPTLPSPSNVYVTRDTCSVWDSAFLPATPMNSGSMVLASVKPDTI